jgi:hypothetical protein
VKARLDTRLSLYGEKRLTDAQVRLLRAVAADAVDFLKHDARTIWSLERRHLIAWADGRVHLRMMDNGIKVLAAINTASAPSTARSAP